MILIPVTIVFSIILMILFMKKDGAVSGIFSLFGMVISI